MALPPPAPPTWTGPERRAHPRISAAAVPHLTAMLVGGSPVRLIDISKRGVQIETTVHMQAGETVAIRLVAEDATTTLAGAVVRWTSAVIEAAGGVTYHTGLAFMDELTLRSEELGEATEPTGEAMAPADAQADDYTMIVMDGRTGQGPGDRTPTTC